ncbi:ExeM/NucH family extracellular endonuclease [Pseudoalteromonas sp. SMS1]|uniref:ExeM/NucH family extracellular endonuclease n=1 Tax=Pseudoalteromonas sp. SMS1 TaxID=2908894 RepID=UPI001F42A8AA|nr:ExeM/NucH family extracellular endonuclease [Pseudoalteromonas sp. SMS1]MCF2855866.1 ExeM/NucH family extracellular endonuclease [Pseudoalteromonas sp. SMS1]
MLKKTLLATAIASMMAPVHASLIVSEYVEGSSYNKAIELFNTSESALDLSEYTLKFYFNGKTTSGMTIALEGSLAPDSTHVVVHARASEALRLKAQQQKDGSWFNGDDAVTLEHNGVVIDSLGQVGYDPGSAWSDQGVSTKDKSLLRASTIIEGDTIINDEFIPSVQWTALDKDDFSDIGKHSSGGPVEPPSLVCDESNVFIHQIQGESASSPMVDEQVQIQGVVTASLQQDGQLKGFFVQEEAAEQDDNNLTSEGIFVNYAATPVSVGEIIKVSGTVKEVYGQTQLNNVSGIARCGNGAVVSLDVTLPAPNGLEPFEGMLVSITNEMVVNDTYGLKRYGEIKLGTERLYQGTQIANPGAEANAVEANNQLKELTLDDGSTLQNPEIIPYPTPELDAYNTIRLGDKVSAIEGPIGYAYSQYRIHPVNTPQFTQTNPRNEKPIVAIEGNLRIASTNVLNFFNGDGAGAGFPTSRGADSAEEYQRQKAKLVSAMIDMDADVIGLLEMENDGFSQLSALAQLTDALNDNDPENNYAYVDFQVDQIGTDAIMSAIVYRSNKVKEVGVPAFTDAVPFDYGNRPPVMQSFEDVTTGDVFNVVINHLRSKGSCSSAEGLDQDQNDGQGCWNQTRINAVNVLNSWLETSPTTVEDEDTIILGDFNAYALEDPIKTVEGLGYRNLAEFLTTKNNGYSYVFKGRLGSLDHAFASEAMANKVVAVSNWHINADEPVALDYNVEYKSEKHQQSLYAGHSYRSSDHDPIIIELQTEDTLPVIEGKIEGLFGWFWWQRFSLEVPEGYSNLEVSIDGLGEADLYLRNNKKPRFFRYDCRPYKWGSQESCSIQNAKPGTWHIGIRGFLPYHNVTMTYRISK